MRALPSLMLAATAVLFVAPAKARDPNGVHAHSPLHQWYRSQYNKRQEWCCDNADAHSYYGKVKLLPDGGVELDGGHKIPAYMVLTGNNPTGHAVWWYVEYKGTHIDYCFVPGSLS